MRFLVKGVCARPFRFALAYTLGHRAHVYICCHGYTSSDTRTVRAQKMAEDDMTALVKHYCEMLRINPVQLPLVSLEKTDVTDLVVRCSVFSFDMFS